MSIEYTPSPEYVAFPIKLPFNGDSTDAKDPSVVEAPPSFNINNVFGNILNRIAHLKASITDIEADIVDLEAVDADMQAEIDAIEISLASIPVSLNALSSQVGGTTYDTSHVYITTGQNHNVCLQILDARSSINASNISNLSTSDSDQNTKITSLGGKLSTNAFNNTIGFDFTGLTLLATGDKTDEAFRKLEPSILTNRRICHQNFLNIFSDWRDLNEILALDTFYDDLVDNSKIYVTSSTPRAYDNLRQSFGVSSGSWVYYNIAKNITPGSDEVKMRLSKNNVGVLTVSATLSGAYDGTFVSIPTENTWTDISSSGATDYIIFKIVGSGGALLYSFSALLK